MTRRWWIAGILNANDAAATAKHMGRTAAKILFAQTAKGQDVLTNDNALVERLRDESIVGMPMENEAADRIEAQAKLIAKLEADNANLFSQVKIADAQWDEKCDRIEAQAAEIEALKTLLAATAQVAASHFKTAKERAAEIERLREAIAGPEAWLDSWAQHVGNCQGGYICTCGLTCARSELSAALGETE